MSDHIPDAGKMVSDTPRTDRNYIGMQIVPASFAMQLERELHAANERIKRLEDIINRAANRFFADNPDGQTAAEMLKILSEKLRRIEKLEKEAKP